MEENKNQVKKCFLSEKQIAGAATVVGAGALVIAVNDRPARADAVSDVTSMVSSLGGIATAATGVILGAMVVRLAIKFVNRLTVKG